MRKTLVSLSMMALLLVLPLVLAMTPVAAASSTNSNSSSTSGDYSTTATFPETGVYCESESSAEPTCTITLNVPQSTTQVVNIEVMDMAVIGDEYSVSVDGTYLFTTTSVPQPTITTLCTESPAGSLASCAAAQTAGDIVQTGIYPTDIPTAQAAGLSVGDADVPLTPGTHTIAITDISSSFTSDFGGDFNPAGLYVNFDVPPSPVVSTPQFPLGLPLLLGVALVGLLIVRKKVLPDIKEIA